MKTDEICADCTSAATSAGEMPRGQKVLLFVLGFLDDLARRGLVRRMVGDAKLTDLGRSDLERLKAEGFEPTEKEFEEAFAAVADWGEENRSAEAKAEGEAETQPDKRAI